MKTLRPGLNFLLVTSIAFGLPAASVAQDKPREGKTHFFPLKHSDADAVAKTLAKLIDDRSTRIVADARSNTLVVKASEKTVASIEQLLKVLDGPPKKAPQVEKNEQFKLFRLEKAIAKEAQLTLQELIGRGVVSISADPRTNSLVISGRKEDVAVVEAILKKLDEAAPQGGGQLRVYPVKHVSVQQILDTLSKLQIAARVATDTKRNRVLVHADAQTQATVEKLIAEIDVPGEKRAPARLQLRIVWLIDAKLAPEKAGLPDKSLDKAVQVLEKKLGMQNLKMASQMVVSVNVGGEKKSDFDAYGSAKFKDDTAQIELTGEAEQGKGGNPLITIRLVAGDNKAPRGRHLAALSTKIAAPAGHTIILGVTPIQSENSVFVLQVLDSEK